jgi:hypothetical protein
MKKCFQISKCSGFSSQLVSIMWYIYNLATNFVCIIAVTCHCGKNLKALNILYSLKEIIIFKMWLELKYPEPTSQDAKPRVKPGVHPPPIL